MRLISLFALLGLVASQSFRDGSANATVSDVTSTDVLEQLPDTTLEAITPSGPTTSPPPVVVTPGLPTPVVPDDITITSLSSLSSSTIFRDVVTKTSDTSTGSVTSMGTPATQPMPGAVNNITFNYDDSDTDIWAPQTDDLLLEDVSTDLGEPS